MLLCLMGTSVIDARPASAFPQGLELPVSDGLVCQDLQQMKEGSWTGKMCGYR